MAYHELDASGIVRRINRVECDLLGYTAAEMLGRPIWEFMAGVDRDASRAAIGRKISGEQPLAPFRRQFTTRSQGRITVELHDRLIHDVGGRTIGIRSTMLNVTDQVAAEEALQESQRWLSGVLHALTDAVIAVDPLGVVKFMNPPAETITGWRDTDAKGRDIEEVLILRRPDPEAAESPLGQLFCSSLVTASSIDAAVAACPGPDLRIRITSSPILADEDAVIGAALIVQTLPDSPAV